MKTALFDLDGTLVDSLEDIALGINLTRQDFGLARLSSAEITAGIGEGIGVLIQRAIPELAATHMPQLRERQRSNYLAHILDNTVLYPGMKETLLALRDAGWTLGVVTNKPGPYIRPILEGLGVWECFAGVIGGGDCEKLKPDPLPMYLLAERMGVTLDANDWMIGDHFTDMEAGKNANMKTCFCRWGIGSLGESSYTVAIDAPLELLRVAGITSR